MKKELDGNSRRQTLLSLLSQSDVPLSGTRLGRETGVSRQVVVQDIALLRTAGYPILSTGRGYILNDKSGGCTRVFKVCHSDEQVEDELQTIVDLGGCIVDVSINHRVYGKVSAPLNIKSRRDTHNFQTELASSKSTLLSSATSGYHYHTIRADSEEILNEIEEALRAKGYLAEYMEYEI
ncbi:DNA-binding transcriptional regulator [Eubacterium sp. An11]|uniref:transcription repressor NadR n=1 Tax=Eubacterium sp. An11 TaxID=1965542 RepID=UPI000B39E2CD|nr:transcription repressor NadR [Eubacterium sp. An11]OUQ65820.1 DNA-binding transcriptional regulator [Eubacterium sp. An11]